MKLITFDDILIEPDYADFKRGDVSVSSVLFNHLPLMIPIISSPMDTVTEFELAIQMSKCGGVGIIHRNLNEVDQAKNIAAVRRNGCIVGAAVGTDNDLLKRLKYLVSANVNFIVIDTAHGHSKTVGDAIQTIKNDYPMMSIMAGNVSTYHGAKFLIDKGVDSIRVGMGCGSICTTRIVTGVGIPQATAIQEVRKAIGNKPISLVADGSIRNSGDIVKAIALGADAVMLGSLLSCAQEAPNPGIYRGMGSESAMKGRFNGKYSNSMPEGVESTVAVKSTVFGIINELIEGLKSGMYYAGASTIKELQQSNVVTISQASHEESKPFILKGGM